MWYGFSFEDNKYDSFTFRMFLNSTNDNIENDKIFNTIIFKKFLYNEKMRYNENDRKIKDISQEYRLKTG